MCKYLCVCIGMYVWVYVQACTCSYTQTSMCKQKYVVRGRSCCLDDPAQACSWTKNWTSSLSPVHGGRSSQRPWCRLLPGGRLSRAPSLWPGIRVPKSAGREHFLGEQYFCRKTAVLLWLNVFVKKRFFLKNWDALFWCFQSAVSITYSKTRFHSAFNKIYVD